MRDRSRKYDPPIASTVTTSPAQYWYADSSVDPKPARPGIGSPVPPPIDGKRSTSSMIADASTQVAIAKYPVRSRDTSHHSGMATIPLPIAAIGRARNGSMPCMAGIRTKYAPRPRNACCPTETRPAYPASRFHMDASVRMMKPCSRIPVRPEYTA
jgi:hypothetical protein